MAASKNNLESTFEKLDEIVERLQNEDISLDDSFKLYSEGIKLVKSCNQQIDKVEKQIVVLRGDNDD